MICIFFQKNIFCFFFLFKVFLFFNFKKKINITLVNKNKMLFLNKKFKNKNYSTNVLSFNYFFYKDKKNFFFPLGDIILCPLVIWEESIKNNWNYLFYFFRVLIHGILHILGFLHNNFLQYKNMRNMEYFFLFKIRKWLMNW